MTQQWKPIESAPKDGTPIIIACIGEGRVYDVYNGHIEVVQEDEQDGAWGINGGEPFCSYVGRPAGEYFCCWLPGKEWEYRWKIGPGFEYTHWMPLPAAPCQTCNDQGAVGNILTAEPCPDCTPPASAQDDAKDERSDTYGMNLGERIAHVGGRTNAQGYTEFGSPMAVNALIQHVLRDIDWTRQDDDGGYQARYRLPGGKWSSWGHVVCGVKGHEQELRYLPAAPAAGDARGLTLAQKYEDACIYANSNARDAARYRWLRDPQSDVALVLDKRTGYVPADERIPGIGGYHTYEYRAGEELDAAIDEAIAASQQQEG